MTSTIADLELRVTDSEASMQSLSQSAQSEISSLTSALTLERNRIKELETQLADVQEEYKLYQRKSTQNQKDLARQLQQAQRKPETAATQSDSVRTTPSPAASPATRRKFEVRAYVSYLIVAHFLGRIQHLSKIWAILGA